MSKGLFILTLTHTAISLVAIAAGMMVAIGLIQSRGRQLWTLLFFVTTGLTLLSGFLFPFNGLTPAFILGVISIFPFTLAVLARYRYRLEGGWRGEYVVGTMMVFYFNCFVLVVQSFLKIPALRAFAPTQNEPPFAIAQAAVLFLFLVFSVFSFRRFRVVRIL